MPNESLSLPLARAKELIVRELADEVLVYDLARHRAHCLNRTAALVWRQCDGSSTPAQIAERLQPELGDAANEECVWLALRLLRRAGLLRSPAAGGDGRATCSRRELARRLGLAGTLAAALPVVFSIVAPTPAMAASCTGAGGSCAGPTDPPCCAGLTCNGLICV